MTASIKTPLLRLILPPLQVPVLRWLPLAALLMLRPGVTTAGEEPKGEVASGVVAESWPLETPEVTGVPGGFEQWRAEGPPAGVSVMALDKLEIPARETASMVRVRGVLVVPQTRTYVLTMASADPAELWLLEGPTGEWRLAQRASNPTNGAGTVKLEAGVPKRFELWTAGTAAATVKWHAWPVNTAKLTAPAISLEVVPGTSLGPVTPGEAGPYADGLPDDWKRRRGLDLASGEGPAGPWGDPDGDHLLNWQERLADTDPRKPDAEGCPGFARWEVWRGIPGKYVFDLTRSGNFPLVPDEVRYLRRLEIPFGNGNRYGSRLRCLVVPPADGTYTFALIANDTAELWLGDDESWQGRKLVAKVAHEGRQLVWPDAAKAAGKPFLAEQVSTGIALQAGRRYYLEVLHKQDDKADYCAVGWTVPGAKGPVIVPGPALTAWAPEEADVNDDGLPDDWQRTAGLLADSIDPALRHGYADPDHDGITNRDEWKADTNPLDIGAAMTKGHQLTCEVWTGLPGERVADLAHAGRYPATPSHTTLVDNLDFSNEGENYGCRLRGYLTAPADGPYVFFVSGNNGCVLWLAESDDKFTKRLLVRTVRDTGWRRFHGKPSQRSEPVVLKRGARYHVELLFKRGTRQEDQAADHSSVAWLRPDRQGMAETVIGREFLETYCKDPRDLDDDDLPDDWEKANGLDPGDPSGINGSWGDQDGDGLENFGEFRHGLDPLTADVHGAPELALWEAWDNLGGLPAAHRDGPGLAPALLADPRFPFHPARREWRDALEAPHNQGTNFAARLRARIIAPVTGDHVFSIAGRDVGELYLSPDDSKFNRRRVALILHSTSFRSWDLRSGQMTAPVRLEAGKAYYIEALHARGSFPYDDDFFSIGWKPPGAKAFEVIGRKHLLAFFRDPNDLDDDDLPDDWEKANGLDPADPRGTNGSLGDPDGDGLANMEEHRFGTGPSNPDTDGDGVSDLNEVRAYNSDPLVSDAIGDAVSGVALDSYVSSSINWTMTSDGLLAGSFRGEATWDFTVPGDGNWLLRLETELMGSRFGNEQMPMVVKVDGQVVGRRDVYFGVGKFGALQVLTQYLDEGTHQVSILVDNMLARRTVRLVSLNVHAPANAAALLAQGNRVIHYTAATRTSPLCVEGYARDVSRVTVNGRSATNGMGKGHWYADIPLTAGDDLQSYAIQYEPGNGTTGTVTWAATNALAGETLAIRRGDSLRVGAWGADPAMASTLTASDGGLWPLIGGQTEVLAFPGSGTFTFRGELRDGSAGTLTVNVFDAPGFPAGTIDALDGTARAIVCGAADVIGFDTEGELATLAVTRPDATSASVSLLPLTPAEFGIAARLGTAGPILGVLRVNVIGISDALQNSLTTQSTSGIPGYKLYFTPLTVTNLPQGGRVDVSILRAGVMFPNGSTLRSILPADLVNCAVRLEFLFPVGLPGAFCHQLLVYDRNGGHLGTH